MTYLYICVLAGLIALARQVVASHLASMGILNYIGGSKSLRGAGEDEATDFDDDDLWIFQACDQGLILCIHSKTHVNLPTNHL